MRVCSCAELWRQLWALLYKKNVFEYIRRQVLVQRNEEVLFCKSESGSANGSGVGFHYVNFDCFGNIQKENVKLLMCSGKDEVY